MQGSFWNTGCLTLSSGARAVLHHHVVNRSSPSPKRDPQKPHVPTPRGTDVSSHHSGTLSLGSPFLQGKQASLLSHLRPKLRLPPLPFSASFATQKLLTLPPPPHHGTVSILFFFFPFSLFGVISGAYGISQAGGRTETAALGLGQHHTDRHTGSEPCLWTCAPACSNTGSLTR